MRIILLKIFLPSFSLIISISLSLKFSGAFSSSNSITSNLQYLDNLFENSSIPSFKYFSLMFRDILHYNKQRDLLHPLLQNIPVLATHIFLLFTIPNFIIQILLKPYLLIKLLNLNLVLLSYHY